jgi:hypothetical protein
MPQRFMGESAARRSLPTLLIVLALGLIALFAWQSPAVQDALRDGLRDLRGGGGGGQTQQGAAPMTNQEMNTRNDQTRDATAFVGQRARLDNVRIEQLVNEQAFVLSHGDERLLLAMITTPLADHMDSAALPEQGQRVSLEGVVRALPATEDIQQMWGLTAEEAEMAKELGVYLEADRISTAL